MKTIRYQKIDGHKVVIAVDRRPIDPEATRKVIKGHLDASKQMKNYLDAVDRKQKIKPMQIDVNTGVISQEDRVRFNDEMAAANLNLDKALNALNEYLSVLQAEHVVHMQPRLNELLEADVPAFKEIVSFKEKNIDGKIITVEGKIIADHRGEEYCQNDSIKMIKKLGEIPPKKSTPANEITDAQKAKIEAKKISELSKEERLQKADLEIADAKKAAKELRADLEIEGTDEKEALNTARKFLQEEKTKIQKKYSVK